MASALYLLGPVLVLLASWSLLLWFDGGSAGRLRLAAACLAAAVAVTAVGVAVDDPEPRPAPPAAPARLGT